MNFNEGLLNIFEKEKTFLKKLEKIFATLQRDNRIMK